MRKTFATILLDQAKHDENIIVITGDLGYSVLDPLQEVLGSRFINAGVAEQNMTGLAAGMALNGKKVFTYSIANFPTLRCLEQIRNDICYHNADVTVVAVGSGFAYGPHGYTHHGIEDISVMRALPHMKVFSPADSIETAYLLKEIFKTKGPCYLRLHKDNAKTLHDKPIELHYPSMLPIITGYNKTILATGAVTLMLKEFILEHKLDCNLWSVPVIKPLDKTRLLQLCESSDAILTIEEHQLAGGFGSAILEAAEDLLRQGLLEEPVKINRIGVPEDIIYRSHSSESFFAECIKPKLLHFLATA